MNNNKLEWYIPETNSFIYDDDVIKLLEPKLEKSISALSEITTLIKTYKKRLKTPSIATRYIEYDELLRLILTIVECYVEDD